MWLNQYPSFSVFYYFSFIIYFTPFCLLLYQLFFFCCCFHFIHNIGLLFMCLFENSVNPLGFVIYIEWICVLLKIILLYMQLEISEIYAINLFLSSFLLCCHTVHVYTCYKNKFLTIYVFIYFLLWVASYLLEY